MPFQQLRSRPWSTDAKPKNEVTDGVEMTRPDSEAAVMNYTERMSGASFAIKSQIRC